MDFFDFSENNFSSDFGSSPSTGSNFGFGSDFGVDSSDFFLSSKERKEEKKKAEKAEKEELKREEQEKKNAKKKAEANAKDMDVPYPFVVIARGFKKEYVGEGTIKLSEVWDNLLEEGYEQFKIDSFGLVYHELSKTVFVSDSLIVTSAKDTLVNMENGVTVVDGMLKAAFEMDNFEGLDEDEVSVGDLIEKWVSINPNYEGCGMYYDSDVNIAYPTFTSLSAPAFAKRNYNSFIKEGCLEMESYDSFNDALSSLKGLLNDIKVDNVSLALQEGKRNFFVSYSASVGAYCRNGCTSSKGKSKKVEEKYILPLTVFVVTWGATYELTSSDCGGKEKITKEELREVMKNRESFFSDSSRKIDTYYDKKNNRLAVNFISGSKGCEMIHSKEELERAKKLDSFDGVYTEAGENFVIKCYKHLNILLHKGKGAECYKIEKVTFERKFPLIPREILNKVIEIFREDLSVECACRILYNRDDRTFSIQKATGFFTKTFARYHYESSLNYYKKGCTQVIDIHSHNTMKAFFSSMDDKDDAYPGLFCVIGELDKEEPAILTRVGFNGNYGEVAVDDIFARGV